jgi:RNA polymerase sigma factor (sigma-70 family)
MPEDRDLLEKYAAEKSQRAFEEYVQRHIGFVYSTALRATNGDTHASTDICQQVFVIVARESARLASHDAPMGWLYVTTRNAARTYMRSEQIRRKHEQSAVEIGGIGADENWEAIRPLIDGAVDELDRSDREAVLLRFFENHPFAEIGRRLNVSENAARMRVDRALDKLHGILAARGVVSTSAALGLTVTAHASATVPGGLAASVVFTAYAAAVQTPLSTGLLTFMSTSKSVSAITAVVAVLSVTAFFYQRHSAQKAQRSAVAAIEQKAALEEQLRSTVDQLREAEKRVASLAAEKTNDERLLSKRTPNGESAPPPTRSQAMRADPLTSPEYVEAAQQKFVASLSLRYGPLYRKLKLTPQQIADFESALSESHQGTLDIWTEATKQGLPTNDPSVLKMTSEPILMRDAKLAAVLGSALQDYREYDKTFSARAIVTTLAGNIYYTDSPLSPAQGESLAEMVIANTEQKKKPLVTDREGKIIYTLYTETDWNKVQQTAQQILSPAQHKALQGLVVQQQMDAQIKALTTSPAPHVARGR